MSLRERCDNSSNSGGEGLTMEEKCKILTAIAIVIGLLASGVLTQSEADEMLADLYDKLGD